MSTDSAVAIVWDVLKCLVAPIKRGFGYVMYSESYANNLGKEVGNLESEVWRVRNAEEVARNNLQNIHNWVPEFLKSAEEALMKARDLLGESEKASKTCCHGTLPDTNCRYQFSRKAKHDTDHIKNLILENSNKEISFGGPAPGHVAALIPAGSEGKDVVQSTTTAASASSSAFESRALMIRKIMDALVDNSCSVVGVHGMGGLGKSTLLVDAEKKIGEKKLFDWVAKADVSQIPDIKRIQGEIADALGLSDIKNKESVSGRAELLHRRLEEEERNKKKVLIILDNLWERLDLKSVGIPCGHDNKVVGCKLLLTSRDRNVLQREMGCDEEFPLDRLEENEARTLFERMVGDKVHDEEFRPWVDETLRKCAGLPLLIVTVAKNFKYAGLSEWRDALNQIERCSNEGISAVINEMLRLSYDHLESEEAKSLLQLCVACGASNPSLENLVRYGYGFGIFRKDSSMKEARDRLSTLIRTLQASSLLLDNGGADGFKIHDLVHDFVAQLVLRDRPLLVLKDEDMLATQLQNERLKNCSSICFPSIDLKELPEKLDCPELRIFLLFNHNRPLEIPESFFNSMKKLAILNLSNVRITRSLTSFQFLENLHTLCLQYCFLEDVAILSKLKGLQVLSFVNSSFQRLPKEIGQLTELRLLDLSHCSRLQVIEPGLLERLIKLEELYMENSFNQWNATEQTQPTNASLIELNHMKNLCTLHVSIPDPSMLPEDLDVEKLTKYKIRIGNAWRWSKQKGSRVLDLKLDLISDVLKKGCIQSVFSKTDDLFLDKLNESKQSICALSQEGFPKLKHLLVQNSLSIHYILQWRTFGAFEMLESLFLEKLINLKKICYSHISSKSFSTLKVIQVKSCDKMEVLFPLSLLRELPQLEEIKVVSCKLIRSIVEGDDHGKVELCNFHVLELRDLPNIKNFFTVGTTPSSSTLDERVGTQISFFNGQQVAFNRLEKLKITGLDNLKFLFSPSMVKSFTQLKNLTISSCKKMKAIIMEEEWLGMETSEILAFPMLIKLHLQRLKSLMCFSHGKCAQESRSQNRGGSRATTLFNQEVAFPSLENLYMEGMDNIEMIWDDQIIADSFSKLKLLSVNECKKLVNVDPSFILGWLKSLETLTIEACESLEVVFKLQALNPLDGHHVAHSPLKKLELYDLPKLNRVWDKELHRQVKFQCLRWVSLRGCARLTSLFSTSIARDLIQLEELEINKCGIVQLIGREGPNEPSIDVEAIEGPSQVESSFPSYFQHMKTIDVSHCHGLSNMFTPTIAKNLVEITKLRISKCDILTEVISDEGGNEGHVVAFNQLKHLELDGLTQMRCFSSGGYTLILPLLEDIIANRCPKMKFFFKGPMEAPKLKRVRVGLKRGCEATEYPYFWKGNVNMTIQNMFEEMATFAGTKFMQLSEFPELIGKWHNELIPITSSWQLESLEVGKCPFINAIPSNLMLVLVRLTTLQVRDCEPLEEIFDLEGLEAVDCTRVFPQLQDLCLVNLPKLRQLWNRDLQGTMCFNSLKHLGLYKCNNLRHAFVPSMARCLPNLRQMEIKECDQMEGVIVDEEGQGSVVEEITFPNLKWINLECLPNLTSFLSWKNHMLECPTLSNLSIAHCPKMISLTWQSSMEIDNGTSSLFTPQVQCPRLERMVLSHMDNLRKIWIDGPQETLTFDNLREIKVHNCRSLENLFLHWVVISLTQLKKLQVESCEIEEIVAIGDDTPHSNTAQDFFPKLTSLVLHDMPQLKSFGPNLSTLNWPLLEELQVTHCDKLNLLSFGASINSWAQRDDQQDLSDHEAHSSFERGFPNFKRLLLVENNIQMIQEGNFPDDIFSKPKALTLACFHDEKAVFPSRFLLERFQNLQSLEVFCSSFEYIFPDEGLVDEGIHPVLELRILKLNKLHNLKYVWRDDSLVSKILQSIKTFEVWDCPCLTTIFPMVTSFQNLSSLVVKNCSRLVHLVTASLVTNLVNLIWITIIGCERMKEVVADDGNGEGKVITFKNLYQLTLQHLPSLECFSSIPSCSFKFPNLEKIEVEECPKMKTFSKGTPSTPWLARATLFRYKWVENKGEEWGEDLNTTIQKLSA